MNAKTNRRGLLSVLFLATFLSGPFGGHPCFAGKYNKVLSIGDQAPEWESLPDVHGYEYSSKKFRERKVFVIAFTCNSCPYAVDYEERMVAFAKKYCGPKRDVALVAINVNKIEDDLPPAMKKRAEEKGFNFPYLFDESQKLAKDFGALRTPQFFVLDEERKVVYMGAMDDSPNAEKVKVKHVENAVEAALDGKPIDVAETPPIGCLIRFDRKRRK